MRGPIHVLLEDIDKKRAKHKRPLSSFFGPYETTHEARVAKAMWALKAVFATYVAVIGANVAVGMIESTVDTINDDRSNTVIDIIASTGSGIAVGSELLLGWMAIEAGTASIRARQEESRLSINPTTILNSPE